MFLRGCMLIMVSVRYETINSTETRFYIIEERTLLGINVCRGWEHLCRSDCIDQVA